MPDTASGWDTELTCDTPYYTWSPTASGQESDPLNCESWYEAYAFCIWDGGFLPSETEWDYTAAGGIKQLPYPWGTSAPASNTDLANYGCKYGNDASVRCHGADSIAPVGLIDAGKGTYGQEDLAGNLSEWTLDGFAAYATPCADCTQQTAISTRVVRGGNFHTNAASLVTSFRDKYMPQNGFYYVGARCARTP
jgi:formylglycine-generating enzyme required for sulfatase activity